jgi:hypothetical protein
VYESQDIVNKELHE